MHLRPATRNDLELLRSWDEKPHVIQSDPDDDRAWETELGRDPGWREQLIAEEDGRAIGFVRITDPAREGNRCWGAIPEGRRAIDIWIGEEADLGKGHGTAIMRLVIDLCFADPGVSALLVDPPVDNERAQRFYERLGFHFVVQRRFGADCCCVYRLTRDEHQASRERRGPEGLHGQP
jgi:aminoglycoside 6'-N-acetyltransferase